MGKAQYEDTESIIGMQETIPVDSNATIAEVTESITSPNSKGDDTITKRFPETFEIFMIAANKNASQHELNKVSV